MTRMRGVYPGICGRSGRAWSAASGRPPSLKQDEECGSGSGVIGPIESLSGSVCSGVGIVSIMGIPTFLLVQVLVYEALCLDFGSRIELWG